MINRINMILRAKNITAKQFAEEIGIQPSGMSHILGGRNNPSLEFVSKVLRRYPEIDANWLLLGRGEMYSASSGDERVLSATEPTLFQESSSMKVAEPRHEPMDQQEAIEEERRYSPSYIALSPTELDEPSAPAPQTPSVDKPLPPAAPSSDDRRMARLLFIYNDGTFEEYRPR